MTRIPQAIASSSLAHSKRQLPVDESTLIWQALFRRQRMALERHGSTAFLRALKALDSILTAAPMPQIPQLDDCLGRLNGWRLIAVDDCEKEGVNWSALARKELVVSRKMRGRHELESSNSNDWFVAAFGRLPGLLVVDFSRLLQRLGQIGQALQTDPQALSLLHRIHVHLVERALVIELDGIGRETTPRLFGASLVTHFHSVRDYEPLDPRWQPYSWEALTSTEMGEKVRFIVRSWNDVHADLDRWFTTRQSVQRQSPGSLETAQCFASSPRCSS
jgi:phenylalanine-4-hydroxylase